MFTVVHSSADRIIHGDTEELPVDNYLKRKRWRSGMARSRGRSNRQRPPAAKQQSKAASQPEKPRRRRLLVILGALGTAGLGVLGVVLGSVLSSQAQRVVPSPSLSTAPRLEVDRVSLTAANTQLSGNTLTITPFRVDMTLLNTGSGVAVINDAQLVIDQFVTLPICASQGYLNTSHAYSGTMPVDPKPGQVINIPLSEEIAANDADRFDLLFGLPHNKLSGNVYLYRVQLYLTYNVNTGPIDVGNLLVDLPVLPAAGEYYWDSYYSAQPGIISGMVAASYIPEYKRCVTSNTHALYSVLSLPSFQPTALAAILPTLRFNI